MTTLAIPNERDGQETRVAVTPDILKRINRLGLEVLVEAGAGDRAGYPDAAFSEAGAKISSDAAALWSGADVIATVRPPAAEQVARMKSGAVLVGMLSLMTQRDLVGACVEQKVSAIAFEFVPRISRAQAVDALSAMASIGGYKAVLLAATHLPRMLPMMMTAAGTVTASRIFVIGAGVAGLQAIATAKRLGAIVEGYDIRPAVKEQVESLGAKFVEFLIEKKEGEGGYAAEQSEHEQQQQRDQMRAVVSQADAVITTAAIPGRPAPKLVDDSMVEAMRPGSVIVDLAAETGGNCTLTKPGEIIEHRGVTIIGLTNLPATVPYHASQMYARVVTTLLTTIVKDGNVNFDFSDEVVDAMTIVHGGEVRNERVRSAIHHGEH